MEPADSLLPRIFFAQSLQKNELRLVPSASHTDASRAKEKGSYLPEPFSVSTSILANAIKLIGNCQVPSLEEVRSVGRLTASEGANRDLPAP